MDHLATTTSSEASVLTPPSVKPGKACRSRACCSRQMGSRRAKAPKDQHMRAGIIVNDDNHRSEETGMKPHQRRRKTMGSREIRRTHDPPSVLDAHPELDVPRRTHNRRRRMVDGDGESQLGTRFRSTERSSKMLFGLKPSCSTAVQSGLNLDKGVKVSPP